MEVLLPTALTLGLVHTLVGPDHYLPFIVLGRAEGWPLRKTLLLTLLCGIGHVLSSVILGFAGVGLGWALSSMEQFEGTRGTLAAYGLIGFGLVYFIWGLWRGWHGKHAHIHHHADGTVHRHGHQHEAGADRPDHDQSQHEEAEHVRSHRRTTWTLVIIFLLGPCEPLIPLLMLPAAQHSMAGVVAVVAVFGVATVGVMLLTVTLGHLGLRTLRFQPLERYMHAMAGATLLIAGLATQLLGI